MHRFGLNPYLELIYQLFKKSDFHYFRTFLGPLGPNYSYSITYFNNYLGNQNFLRVHGAMGKGPQA